jgi:hypothetical protein
MTTAISQQPEPKPATSVTTPGAGPAYPQSERRPLQVYLYDPLLARLPGASRSVTITVPYEPLEPGPVGALVAVMDFDGAQRCYYSPVDLDHSAVLISSGLTPTESDPRFHQQMCYAVVMSVLERFERALGRRFRWHGKDENRPRLTVVPHAFYGANAYFDPETNALLFGYFTADAKSPGRNLPGQTVYTCLSQDIIAHETSHAVMYRLRPRFQDPTNKDVYAFHEAFADIVAMLNHFTQREAIVSAISDARGSLERSDALLDLARQFGEGTGRGRALRSALGTPPDPSALAAIFEPHLRGAVLVAGVFDGFLATYRSRVADLLRIATGGTGELPVGALPMDLVGRLAHEATRTAEQLFVMCGRALDYLPPVDVTFGDFIRALVTADRDLYPDDRDGLRSQLIEALRVRGVYPSDVASLADDALPWSDMRDLPREQQPEPIPVLDCAVLLTAREFRRRGHRDDFGKKEDWTRLIRYGTRNASRLGLFPGVKVSVPGMHAAFRLAEDGQPRLDIVVQFLQHAVPLEAERKAELGGVSLYGGTTVIADADGSVRHVISKPLPVAPLENADSPGVRRLDSILHFVDACKETDPLRPWSQTARPITKRFNFATIDGMS